MFRILVADDETFIRRGIVTILRRALPGEDLVFFEAANGEDALRLCAEHTPQLVISDIRMPCCSGLEFIRRLREQSHSPAVIILSGYEDFEYAQEAIRLGVREYVLKPVKKTELVELVRGYIHNIRDEEQRREEEVAQSISSRQAAETLKRTLMMHLLDPSGEEQADEILGQLAGIGVRFQNKLFLCAAVQVRIDEGNHDYIESAAKNIIDEILEEEFGGEAVTVPYDPGRIAVILAGAEQEALQSGARAALSRIVRLLEQYLAAQVFVGVGDMVYNSVLLHRSFQLALQTTDYKIYGSGRNIQLHSELPAGAPAAPLNFDSPLDLQPAAVIAQLDRMLAPAPSRLGLIALRESYYALDKAVYRQLARCCLDGAGDALPRIPPFASLWSAQQLRREVTACLRQAGTYLCEHSTGAKTSLLMEIVRYVQDNATDDINLNLVAQHFSRSPSYISSLFKKETGQSFTDYITAQRVKAAKQMLADTRIPIGQVSALCGYVNSKYFSVVFKKATGQSPASYREACQIEGNTQ